MRKLVCGLVLALMPGLGLAETIVVFAAASLKPALDPVAALWMARTGDVARVSYGSSSALARQIEAGAGADVYLAAAVNWMDYLQERDLIDAGSRVDLWGNALSLLAHDPMARPFALDATTDLAGLLGDEKLAMALVDAVPVGQYGKAALEALGLWQSVAGQVVQTQDARATVALVATGEAGFGVVYATDARAAEAAGQGIEVARFPDGSHVPVIYPGARVAGSGKGEADDFLAFLGGPAATGIFAALGYGIVAR